jgi:hypothetical protein
MGVSNPKLPVGMLCTLALLFTALVLTGIVNSKLQTAGDRANRGDRRFISVG